MESETCAKADVHVLEAVVWALWWKVDQEQSFLIYARPALVEVLD